MEYIATLHVITVLLLSGVACNPDRIVIHGSQNPLLRQVEEIHQAMDYFRNMNQSHSEIIQKQNEIIREQSEMIERQSAIIESVSHLQRSHDSLNASLAAMEQANDASFASVGQALSGLSRKFADFNVCLVHRNEHQGNTSGIITTLSQYGMCNQQYYCNMDIGVGRHRQVGAIPLAAKFFYFDN